ncbi:hypothetical protein HELRODRAFT_69419, partial [Helobdella robusta]|uniref:Uncharacterized protein n=1 Tax=Helobdella robusta TaxID=6412 RepID=T1FZV1_HELRO
LVGVTTDGAPCMTGKNMAKSVPQNIITHHGIIHQENLGVMTLDMKHVMEKVVSCKLHQIKKSYNQRKFKSFVEVGSDHDDVIYFCQVRWLSKSTTLSRFWNLRQK